MNEYARISKFLVLLKFRSVEIYTSLNEIMVVTVVMPSVKLHDEGIFLEITTSKK